MTIAYRVGNGLYLNITNKCSCACTFCVRMEHDGVGEGENLWLEREPTLGEIIAALETVDLNDYDEVVFCGYGEPTERLDIMLEVCRYLKKRSPGKPIRLNTNGLSDRLVGQDTAPQMEGLIDEVSISLNAPTPDRYQEIVRPSLGAGSYQAMLAFAERCKQYVPQVKFTVVDILQPGEVEACRALAESMAIPLRVRPNID